MLRNAQKPTPPVIPPDIVSSHYPFFCSIAHGLENQQFYAYEDISKWLDSVINSNYGHLYLDGIRALSESWEHLSLAMVDVLSYSFLNIFHNKRGIFIK